MSARLSENEMARWVAWKRATDRVWDHVVGEIGAATGLSAADFSVLTRVVEAGEPLRQQQLADLLGWQRSRLSRQLSRMADRDLVERSPGTTVSLVHATAAGAEVAKRARKAHAQAVRAALLRVAPESAGAAFWKMVAALGDLD